MPSEPPEVVDETPRDSMVDVFLRIRPLDGAREQGERQCIRTSKNWACVYDPMTATEQWFEFEGVVDSCTRRAAEPAGQEAVFDLVGKQAVASVIDGFNTCVFSMGQTGTGKTYTLIGTADAPGLLPAILERLLQEPRSIRFSCLELHMDRLRDLLADDPNSPDRPVPEIRCIPQRGVYVSNLSEVSVEDPQAALKLAHMASRQRMVSRTHMNATSSRGHAVFQLTMESGARLCIVDLAGRENERTTGCQGQSLAELGYINKSLFHLTNVIQALSRPKSPRNLVPFRNSKLTLLLSDCLSSSRTSLVATVSPARSCFDETLTTVRLSQAVRGITTRSRRGATAGRDAGRRVFERQPQAPPPRSQAQQLGAAAAATPRSHSVAAAAAQHALHALPVLGLGPLLTLPVGSVAEQRRESARQAAREEAADREAALKSARLIFESVLSAPASPERRSQCSFVVDDVDLRFRVPAAAKAAAPAVAAVPPWQPPASDATSSFAPASSPRAALRRAAPPPQGVPLPFGCRASPPSLAEDGGTRPVPANRRAAWASGAPRSSCAAAPGGSADEEEDVGLGGAGADAPEELDGRGLGRGLGRLGRVAHVYEVIEAPLL